METLQERKNLLLLKLSIAQYNTMEMYVNALNIKCQNAKHANLHEMTGCIEYQLTCNVGMHLKAISIHWWNAFQAN